MPKRESFPFVLSQQFSVENIRQFETAFYLNSNDINKPNYLAIGELHRIKQPTFDALNSLVESHKDWTFGFLCYDAKNQLENLSSKNPASHIVPDIEFVVPELVFEWIGNSGEVYYHKDKSSIAYVKEVLKILTQNNGTIPSQSSLRFESRISKEQYLEKIKELKAEIQYGNIYEINFCQEFYSNQSIDPYAIYENLNSISPTPYSCFVNVKDFYLMCASPEQFIQKTGRKLISRPIKGTIKRSPNSAEDKKLKDKLFNSVKDRSENVMIVDLVRNDFSKSAEPGSVQVEELYGIYSFPQVHQMISTVSCNLKTGQNGVQAIKNAFPMGSMTGAPKIKSMELIEDEENFRRSLYSGSVGFIKPDGDFNFNVVIRSLFYSASKPLLTFSVGGAITDGSDALDEYHESLLKAKAIFDVFS